MQSPDWGYAYEQAINERLRKYRKLRAKGSGALVRVPGTMQSYCLRDLDDDEIRSVAIFEAEVSTNMAINQTRRR